MRARWITLLSVALLVHVGCSGGAKSEKETAETETVEQPGEPEATTEPSDDPSAKADLAPCTEKGAVPEWATSCLLDLGTGEDTYWADTDGVAPGTAGCHDEYETETCSKVRTGRTFGEFCLDDDRLVESNPGVDECHTHKGDLGKPDVVSCSEWCQSETGSAGRCEGGIEAEAAEGGTCESARCVCDSAA